jgi:hypothetical protein
MGTHYKSLSHTLVFSVIVFIALLGGIFQWSGIFGFSVQWLPSSPAGTFQLQLPSWTNWLPTAKLAHSEQWTPSVALA